MLLDKSIDPKEKIIEDLEDSGECTILKGRTGRPILVSSFACWQRDLEKGPHDVLAVIMGGIFMIIIAMLVDAVRYLREGFESNAYLVIARNKVDVNTRETTSELECDADDKDCLQVVEEVVVPLKLKRRQWRHIINALLYGIQCGLQLQCLIGVLSLNVPLIAAVLLGVFLGRLCFYWRPRQKPFSLTSNSKRRKLKK